VAQDVGIAGEHRECGGTRDDRHRRGAVRIASDRWVGDYANPTGLDYGVTAGLDNVAVENPDGSKVLEAYNNAGHPIRFQVVYRDRGFSDRLASGATVTFTWH
jgi:Glycosyl hydrolase family 30 beta sandwich domain